MFDSSNMLSVVIQAMACHGETNMLWIAIAVWPVVIDMD